MNISKDSTLNFDMKREIKNILNKKGLMVMQKISKNNNNLNEKRINIIKEEDKINNKNNNNNN